VGNLNVIILAGSRLPFAMSERGELPRIIAATHKRFRTPHVSILITSVVVLGLTLGSTFSKQVNLSVIARLLSYGVTCAALLVFRRKQDARPAMFKAPAGAAAAIAALLLAAWLLSNISLRDARDSALAAGVGLVIYFGYRLAADKQGKGAILRGSG
jgi:amino acid transporter